MSVDPALLEIHVHTGPSYRPLVDYGAWRVAVLNHVDHLDADRLHDMQRHDETDEVFVLLQGRCILLLGDGDEEPGRLRAVDLEPGRIYNVKRGAWHNHVLGRDASVLVIENRDTTEKNSPKVPLAPEHRAFIVAETVRLWGPDPA